ncbi:MAG: nucleotidyltransferase [Polaromonas sp. 39-63-203]|jgi:uncharacterized protein with HEPN domain|uniref:HepT-like ribonuclease domain-containing protein n=1 Tax=Polaromonas sp. TaxID=1869339 RepID=UPI000BDD51CA|nr:DUF86 domain-containing protein [Polaromonas sp.]OYY53966.1 MAG: nucleotidyltransferase [Polaromonas sp. 35-63-240]OYZ03286.1 MAG: nucleotidyltransferase [Polaromonas sp. 28-63-22]OYZ85108.1 MAG: nucleotidyltransferase [Polaromonas sp. 24-62-144]OZA99958.1 MAG: nucleotidyltransferase [Polaromonas sp. 39-63-203]HQS90497.1 DUF86 domain-containing protein [Polaromonas sp.]
MSEATSPREWRFYVHDMIGFCERILAFTRGTGRAEFPADAMRYDATVRNIELVGEAATHVPESIRQNHPEIPWRMIIATRNQLIHGYLGIDDDVLWSIVQSDIPALLTSLRVLNTQESG